MSLARPLSLLAATTLLSTAALAFGSTSQSVCFTDSIPLQSTNWNNSVSIPKFDPSLGTLQQIQFTLSGTIRGQAAVESLDAQPTNINTQFSATLTLTRPDLSVIVVTIPIANFVDAVTAFDGTIDFGGTSGVTHPNIVASDSDMAVSPPPASDLALFTATFPGETITLPVTASGNSIATGPGNVITQFLTSAEASCQVCYVYAPNIPPVFTEPTCNGTYMSTAGVPFSIQVCAADQDPTDTVTLTPINLPPGATFTPTPAVGNPACGTFDWTPTLQQLGTTQVCFLATDTHQRTTTCCFNVDVAECFQFLGRGAGGATIQIGNTLWQSQLGSIRLHFPVTMLDRPSLRVPMLTSGSLSFSMQTVMHNPLQFPQNADQWSNRLRVTVLPGGVVQGELFGTLNGVHQSLATYTDPNGDLYMTFPFAIDGM